MEDLFGAPPAAAAAPAAPAAAMPRPASDKDLFATSGPAVNIDLGITQSPA